MIIRYSQLSLNIQLQSSYSMTSNGLPDNGFNIGDCIAVKVTASDSDRDLHFFATSVDAAIEKATLMSYRNVQGEQICLGEMPKTKHYNAGATWAKDHKPTGNPTCDAFWITSYQD